MTKTLNSNSNVSKPIKFLYSYGGKIVLRPTDGKLRYVGGHTRVLSVDRSISFSEIMIKFGESCGTSMNLKCKLPNEDLDVLVSIKSDEELKNVVEEYEREKKETKIVAVLYATDSAKKVSSPTSPMSCFDFPSPPKCHKVRAQNAAAATYRFYSPSPVMGYRVASAKHLCHERRPVQFYSVVHRNCSH